MDEAFDIATEFLTDAELESLGKHLDKYKELHDRDRLQSGFLDFVRYVWPSFIAGNHHKIFADKLERVARGDLKRLIVNMPPRHTKSEFASYLFPAWVMGQSPETKIIQATHTAELAVGFGRKVKNLLDSDIYRDVFPKMELARTRRPVVVGQQMRVVSITRLVWAAL